MRDKDWIETDKFEVSKWTKHFTTRYYQRIKSFKESKKPFDGKTFFRDINNLKHPSVEYFKNGTKKMIMITEHKITIIIKDEKAITIYKGGEEDNERN